MLSLCAALAVLPQLNSPDLSCFNCAALIYNTVGSGEGVLVKGQGLLGSGKFRPRLVPYLHCSSLIWPACVSIEEIHTCRSCCTVPAPVPALDISPLPPWPILSESGCALPSRATKPSTFPFQFGLVTMSSLKHIMDVDVEPLDLYRRKDTAPPACLLTSIAPPSQIPGTSPLPEEKHDDDDDSDGNRPLERCGFNRSGQLAITTPSLQISSATSQPSEDDVDLHPDQEIDSMDYQPGFHMPAPAQSSVPSPQVSSTGSEYGMDRPVKYTPVTGRISRAKKGVPVHTCDICRPVKTFTRAEHLR